MGNKFNKVEILDRLKEHYNLKTNVELSNMLGIAPTTLSNWYTRNTVDFDVIFTKCDIDLNWLIRGENVSQTAELKKDEVHTLSAHPKCTPDKVICTLKVHTQAQFNPQTKKSEGIPYYSIPPDRGEATPAGYIQLPGLNVSEYFPAQGCSMKPDIWPGDVLGVDTINALEQLDADNIYFVITDTTRMIKHLRNDLSDPDVIWCSSPNSPEFPLSKSSVRHIYKIVFAGRLV